MAEFWADGPKSETPPGHWNVLANLVSDELAPNLRVGGVGAPVDRLQWDVKMYLALNGAVHDAAIAAWGLKGEYDGTRPISMIRYMAEQGQSSDPALPSYSPARVAARPRADRAGHQGHDRARAATRDIGRQRGSDRDQGVAGQPEGPEDADQRRRRGSSPPTGSRTSSTRSSPPRSRATRRATARSAGPPRRSSPA